MITPIQYFQANCSFTLFCASCRGLFGTNQLLNHSVNKWHRNVADPSQSPIEMSAIPAESDYSSKETKRTVLDAKATESLVERLYTREADRIQKRNKAFDDAVEFQSRHNSVDFKRRSKTLSAQEEVIVKNCYDNQIALQKKKRELQENQLRKEAEVSVKRLNEEDRDDIVSRLYNHSMETRKKNMETLTRKTYGTNDGRPQSPVKRDKAGLDAAIAHLYTEAINKKKESDEKLEAKYGWKKVKTTTMDPQEIQESATRLSSKSQ